MLLFYRRFYSSILLLKLQSYIHNHHSVGTVGIKPSRRLVQVKSISSICLSFNSAQKSWVLILHISFFLLFQNVENFDMCLCLALFNGPFPFNRKTNIWKESNRKRYRQFKKWMWIGFSSILCTLCMVMLQHNLKWYVGKYLFQTRSKSQNCNSKFILQTLHLHGHTTQISHNL